MQSTPLKTMFLAAVVACPAVALGQNYNEDYGEPYQRQGESAEVDAARQQIRDAARRVRATWKADSDFIALEKKLETDQQAFEAERVRVMEAALESNTDYRELHQESEKIDQQLNQMPTPSTQPSDTEEPAAVDTMRMYAAKRKLGLREEIAALERQLIAEDEKAMASRKTLDATHVSLAEMQAELDKLLLTDPEYKQAQDALAQAQGTLGNRR